MAKSKSSTVASGENNSKSQTRQRTTNPGVRLIGGRIYDSERGKTCHQCRQKTRSFSAGCKNQTNNKPCTLVYCHKCLLNRYKENAEEVEVLEEWNCPKCRGICNCSCCRKRQGQKPTGVLCRRTKLVSDLFLANGFENDSATSPKTQRASEKVLEEWNCPKCRGICNCSCCRKRQGQKPTGVLCRRTKLVSDLFLANGSENDSATSPKTQRASEKVLEEWNCPKCRGICNCSCCRKRQGQKPTGVLCRRTKLVSDLFLANGSENDSATSPKTQRASEKVLEEWNCPKCRGICNCSCCRKRQGQKPTGVLCRRTKLVSDLFLANGSENDSATSPKTQRASEKVLEEWNCPKCRGICNCSCCRKRQGKKPTGVLCRRTKLVSDLFLANGSENDSATSPKTQRASEKEIASPRKKEKENLFDGRVDVNVESPTSAVSASRIMKLKESEKEKMQGGSLEIDSLSKCCPSPDKNPKKTKQGTSKKLYANQKDAATLKGCSTGASLENSPSKPRLSDVSNYNEVIPDEMVAVLEVGDGCMTKVSPDVPADSRGNKKRSVDNDSAKPDKKKAKMEVKHYIGVHSLKDNISGLQFKSQDLGAEITLPLGNELTTIGDVKLPLKDVGNALQLLEFCAAFGETLNMKKGQPSSILQELMNRQSKTLRKSEQPSCVVQFHIQLLTLLNEESESRPQKLSPSLGKNSWLLALKKFLSESPHAIEALPIDFLDKEAGGYYALDASTKLKILIFLCDEVLETVKIRDWINDQESKFAKTAKPPKEKVIAAKDKEKSMKQKVMNELANAIIAKDGAPLSISEHDEIVRRIKCEAAQAHKEMLKSTGMVPKTKERARAVRTEPIFLDVDGRAFWRLNGYSEESNILVQDIGNGDDSIIFGEKWTTFDAEQEKMVEKHISFRKEMLRVQPVAEVLPSQTDV
ncbi:uncharacterized protein LOC141693316 [Apium graveolens]|uniref:uncharacterized protein LOC141693316 n=1 Tax=Apium graveolens TaxID=4045 RepID=UPI003D7BFC83